MSVKMKKSARGFTLIELVIVIAVIAILAALLVPTILGQAERARISRANSEVNEIGKAFARMRTDVANGASSTYSTCFTLTNLTSVNVPASNVCGSAVTAACSANTTAPGSPCWGGPYMAAGSVSADPWANAYIITINTTTGSVQVTSRGQDANQGTSDDISKTF